MKVLYFTRGYSPHDDRFLKALVNTSHEIHFLRLERNLSIEPPTGVHELRFLNSAYQINKTRTYINDFKRLVSVLKPDVVHAGPVHGPAHIAAKAGFSPLVTMSWGSDLLYDANQSTLTWLKSKDTLRHTDILVGDCEAVANKAASMGFARDRIFLFPWGVDLQHFNPYGGALLREKLGWQNNFVFLSNRSFEKIYGVDVIIRGFIEAVKRHPEIRLLLFGRGSLESSLRQMITSAEITDKVFFGSFASREDLPAIYRSADVYVSASHSDGSSVSLMEALACGRPALASDIAGNLEWINHGENGWIFEDGNSRSLTEIMTAVTESKSLERFQKAARLTAEKKADWTRNFPILLQAYDAAVELNQNKKKALYQ